jgi:hypothetical protein
MAKVGGREYPVRKESHEFEAFRKSKEYKIHGIYEETMLEVDTATALATINEILAQSNPSQRAVASGHDAATETIRLMYDVQKRLPPKTIIGADDPKTQAPARAKKLWKNNAVRGATLKSLADSTLLLADLWTAAWKIGGGDLIDLSQLKEFGETDLENIYRYDHDFVPSLSLAEMVESGNYEL